MSKILVPPELLFRVANEFHTASIQLEWTINLLNQQISTMLVWDGTTRQRFFDDFHRARNEMTLTIEHMKAISDELKRIANKFILVDEELQPLLSVRSSREESEPKTWQDHIEEFGQGIKSGARGVGESIVDTGKALFEDPLGTMGQMAYNATIGFAEEVSDTAIWGAKVALDVGDTRDKFGETIDESGGMANYLGEQGVMLAGGFFLRRVGVKNNKNDSGGDGGGSPKKDEGTPQANKTSILKRTQEEIDDLGRDPAHGNQITEKGIIERDIGLDLEARGSLFGIKRDPSGAAEFIDANGTKWDIKGFNSNYPPKKGGFRLDKASTQIEKEFEKGENVIIDTTKMSSQHIEELRKAIEEKNLGNKILWWP